MYYCYTYISGAPPKHRVLEHRQPKHLFLNNRLSKTSTVKNINCQKHRLSKRVFYQNIDCQLNKHTVEHHPKKRSIIFYLSLHNLRQLKIELKSERQKHKQTDGILFF
jgi:hypothetical protein